MLKYVKAGEGNDDSDQKGELNLGCGLIAVKEAAKIYDLIRQNGVL